MQLKDWSSPTFFKAKNIKLFDSPFIELPYPPAPARSAESPRDFRFWIFDPSASLRTGFGSCDLAGQVLDYSVIE
jgi:hypothetical protein